MSGMFVGRFRGGKEAIEREIDKVSSATSSDESFKATRRA